ncbi:methylmalonyl Co-A mutase-associated GTPase MeaB [Deinococcus maricopensis]|uniref:LAO/AO transport system ATPase n=1 Tax=Deinococcus maricopensis (strain DSM 21211 / LMG 22137 / NRRL B-23946 / LB-34) TaxID=709986 RepID=E8U9E0_DEIML|nr:methylmalonyl Co-A mutase-associated GTPase MeaB [Deinococcus maricopensis]ADV67679.1 LAO/AO transport system ATPase [Deinococcus maricopensis DSM 21211]
MTPADPLLPGVLDGDRRTLAKAITLLESTRADHEVRAQALLAALLPRAGRSVRVGLTGVPGVGKSTFIEALGTALADAGKRVAVLAVDPSSERTGGSIMGDKTRMARLSVHPNAFVRPSPSRGTLGGVARRTREAMIACEAAGFDVILVETVGVGQSEVHVAGMTDAFVLLTLPNAGDELQGIKRGIMELADVLVVNKADADPNAANRASTDLRNAVRLLTPHGAPWTPPVLQVSALTGAGVPEVWAALQAHADAVDIPARRRTQTVAWFEALLREAVWHAFERGADHAALRHVRAQVETGELTPVQGVRALLPPARQERA